MKMRRLLTVYLRDIMSNRLPAAGLWLSLVLYLAVAAAYLWVTPPLEGFDAIAHMNHINYLRKEGHFPPIDRPTADFSYELITQPPLYYAIGALASTGLSYADADSYTRAQANRYFPGLSQRQSIDLPTTPPAVRGAWLIARLVSLLGGAITVVTAWLWVRALVPTQPGLATAVAAFVGLNPLFLFIATSITNDAWAAAGMSAVVWLTTLLAQRDQSRWWQWLLLGCVAGLAALTKYSVLLVALPALIILLQHRRLLRWPAALTIVVLIFAGVALTAGIWYGRSLLHYGELIPLTAMSTTITTLQRPVLMGWDEVWTLLPFLFYSYWGLFVAIFAPASFFRVVQILALLGTVGFVISLFRFQSRQPLGGLLLALLWFGATLISMINYMRLISFGEQARFLLPASPALGLLLVVGWRGWLPQRAWPLLYRLILLGFIGIALWPLPTLRTAYATPTLSPVITPTYAVNATFAGGMTLVGYDLPAGAALVGDEALPLDLHFTTAAPITDDYTLFLQLVNERDEILYQYDGAPYAGRYPTRAWQPNTPFVDPYVLTVTPPTTTRLATLMLGFYPFGAPNQRLTIADAAGAPIGDRLLLGQVRLLPAAPTPTTVTTPFAEWAAGIALLATQVNEQGAQPGTVDVQLRWQTSRLLQRNYTIFVQFLDASGLIVGQHDGLPQAGNAPTATWLVNEPIDDLHRVTVSAPWQQLIVGLYDPQTGVRLPLLPDSAHPDFVVIAERR